MATSSTNATRRDRTRRRSGTDDNAPRETLRVTPFNPLHRKPLGESVSRALNEQPCRPLGGLPYFLGAGVYAIYYHGNSPHYLPLARDNARDCVTPIYVGKAEPEGSRTGTQTDVSGPDMWNRLREHADSIRQVEDFNDPVGHLRLADFKCRFLVVEDVWIPLIESLSITHHRPPWNQFLAGFGHHHQGWTRVTQRRSLWDTLHPGRTWAARFRPNDHGQAQVAAALERWWLDPRVRLPRRQRRAEAVSEPEEVSLAPGSEANPSDDAATE